MLETVAEELERMEAREGKFLSNAKITPSGEVQNPVFADFGPGEVVIDVMSCSANLAIVRGRDGYISLDPVEVPAKYREEVESWMHDNIREQGGAINLSGWYRAVLPFPYVVRKILGVA